MPTVTDVNHDTEKIRKTESLIHNMYVAAVLPTPVLTMMKIALLPTPVLTMMKTAILPTLV